MICNILLFRAGSFSRLVEKKIRQNPRGASWQLFMEVTINLCKTCALIGQLHGATKQICDYPPPRKVSEQKTIYAPATYFTKQGSFSNGWGTWTLLTCTQGCGEKKSQAVSIVIHYSPLQQWVVIYYYQRLPRAAHLVWPRWLPPLPWLTLCTYKHTTTSARKQKRLHLHKIINWPQLILGWR